VSARPPVLVRLLLRIVPEPHRTFVAGDLYEEFSEYVVPRRGLIIGSLWLLGQALRTVVAFSRHRSRRPRLPLATLRIGHAYRSLRRRPGLVLLASTTLGVGIGAATSVYSAADWILFRPVTGVRDPDQVVVISFQSADGSVEGISLPNLHDLAAGTSGISHTAAFATMSVQAGADPMQPASLLAHIVTGGYFDLLGIEAAAGRLLTPAEADGTDAAAVVVMSYDLWTRDFGAAADVIGSDLRINGRPYTVIGVMDAAFTGVDRLADVDLWLPGGQYSALRHAPDALGWRTDAREARLFQVTLARLAPGTDAPVAEAQLHTAMSGLVRTHPEANQIYETHVPVVFEGLGLRPHDREGIRGTVASFTIVVLVTLLIACANVANLLVVRGLKRRGELAVRRALGATGAHLYVQHVLEALLLAIPAAGFGLLFAAGLNRWFWATGFVPTGPLPDIRIDWRVALFAAVLTVVTAISFSVLPAFAAVRSNVAAQLSAVSRSASGTIGRLQGTLIISQLALSLSLVATALVLVRTITNLQRVDIGFVPGRVMVYHLDPGPQGYPSPQYGVFHQDVVERMERESGMTAASGAYEPFGGIVGYVAVGPNGVAGDDRIHVQGNWVASDYFNVLSVPVIAGRSFDAAPVRFAEHDAADPTVIVSRQMAEQLFGDENVLGRAITVQSFAEPRERRIVGVVGDVVEWNPRRPAPPMVYLPLSDMPMGRAALLVRTGLSPADADRAVISAVAGVDPNVPVSPAGRIADRIAQSMAQERSLARVLTVLALLASGLAGIGLYSIVAYLTTQRTKEFGIRVALGARESRIVYAVMLPSLSLGVWGTAVGFIASLALSRVISSRVFGVAALDPVSLGWAALAMLLLSVGAAIIPAWTTLRVDPVRSLRVS
jgi:predicted permease